MSYRVGSSNDRPFGGLLGRALRRRLRVSRLVRRADSHKTFLSASDAYTATPTAGSIGLSHGRRAMTRHVSTYPACQRASIVAGEKSYSLELVSPSSGSALISSRCMVVAQP